MKNSGEKARPSGNTSIGCRFAIVGAMVFVVPGCGSSGTTNFENHSSMGGSTASSSATSSGNGGTGVSNSITSATPGGAASTGGTAASSATTSSWAVVTNGAPCAPIAARGCSSENTVAQMVCSAGNVWQWSADCSTGMVCDPRPGLKVGQCVAPDEGCVEPFGLSCDAATGIKRNCERPGFLVSKEVCVSAACDGTDCKAWDPCEDWWLKENAGLYADCTAACGRVLEAQYCKTPAGTNKLGLDMVGPCNSTTVLAVPAAANWPVAIACPEMRVFWLWNDGSPCSSPVHVELPPQYALVPVSANDAKKNQGGTELLNACGLGADYVSPTQYSPGKGEAAIIITRDVTAPGFRLLFN